MTQHTVIVGGGLTGILYALRLSQNSQEDTQISIIDSNETLGGRFFFAQGAQKGRSGFGFENENPNDLDTLKRHIFLSLNEDEKNFLDQWVHTKLSEHPFQNRDPKRYFVRKELLNAEYVLLSNSEFLTKKDAEFLHSLTDIDKLDLKEEEKDTSFEQCALWKNAHKSIKENTISILENVVGKHILKLPLKVVSEKMHFTFCTPSKPLDPFFLRIVEIESAFAQILEKRGVNTYTQCTLRSFEENSGEYSLCIIHKDFSELICQKLIFTIPPYNLRMLIAKEHLSSELSRFINKVQPTSLICLELHNFKEKLLDDMSSHFHISDRFYFPVEGGQAYVTSDGRLIASLELDYETSLQAPAVREALTRLRRSMRRILKPEFADELKKGAFIRKTEAFEKIILLPIAYNLPFHIQNSPLPALSDVSCNFKNIYIAGDYFHTLGETNWKRIVKSVDMSLNI